MNPLQEALNKTGIKVVGLVSGINEFTGKPTVEEPNPKTYYSCDLIIKDHKNALTVKLPENFDRGKIQPGEMVSFNIQARTYNKTTSFYHI